MAEIRNLTRNGETFYPLTHVEGVINKDGEPLGIVNDIFDISEYNSSGTPLSPAKYASLDLAIAAIPQNKQKGGMTIRYIQTNNKYIQYRLISNEWSINTDNWAIYSDNILVENPEFIYLKADINGKILEGTKKDGTKVFPTNVEFNNIGIYKDVINIGDQTKINGEINISDTLKLLMVDNSEFIAVLLDENQHILCGLQKNGNLYFGGDIPEQTKDYITLRLGEIKKYFNDLIIPIKEYIEEDKKDTINFINPCEDSNIYTKFGEPTMVIANDGTIIISAQCATDSEPSHDSHVLITFSHDGGKTWHTDFTGGKRGMVYDRVNDRLLAIEEDYITLTLKVYTSERDDSLGIDYGDHWHPTSTIHFKENSPVEAELIRLKQQEKSDYEQDSSINRYAYVRNKDISNWPILNDANPGCQLKNGIICFVVKDCILKYHASKDGQGNWIVDENGFPTAVNQSFNNIVDIPIDTDYVIYTKDGGITWYNSPNTPVDVIMEETCIVEAGDNQVCLNARGGTEYFWNSERVCRHIFFQKTPVDDAALFEIDEWVSDYGDRVTNSIEDSLVNAGCCKVENYVAPGSDKEPTTFWLFCNIYNPNGFERINQMLRLSTDAHNWLKMKEIRSYTGLIGGYVCLASYNSKIYLTMEGNRTGDKLRFAILSDDILENILSTYSASKIFY